MRTEPLVNIKNFFCMERISSISPIGRKSLVRVKNYVSMVLKLIVCNFIVWTGFLFLYRRFISRGSLNILMYHKINNQYDPIGITISPNFFQKQLNCLVKNYEIISLSEAVKRVVKNTIDENYVVLTFDDGFRDNYIHAYPMLKKLSVPAVIFLTHDAIESGFIGWHLFDTVILRSTKTDLDLTQFNVGRYCLKSSSNKSDAIVCLHRQLKTLDDDIRQSVVAYVLSELGNSDSYERIMLTWEEIQEMQLSGLITFGAHTMTHPILTRVSRDVAFVEIRDSKCLVEEKVGSPVQFFAYPNGSRDDFDEDIMAMVKECGYRAACSTISREHFKKVDIYSLPRTDITTNVCCGLFGGFSENMFLVKISGLLDGFLFRS